jgi:UDPglucose--hexose-1-phosphate uridylyltransferase
MAELRRDPIHGHWVAMVPEREDSVLNRPRLQPPSPIDSPFMPGAIPEKDLPIEITVVPAPEGSQTDWLVKVLANRLPVLTPDVAMDRSGLGIYDNMSGVGAHEIIVESPQPDSTFFSRPAEHNEVVLQTLKNRITDLKRDIRLRYIFPIKEHGPLAGAKLAHPLIQLLATPYIPVFVKIELENTQKYFLFKDRCIYCDMIRQEIGFGERIVAENQGFVALCPYASRFPFEVWVLPKKHQSDFACEDDTLMSPLGEMLGDLHTRLDHALSDPDYHWSIHSSPNPVPRDGFWKTLKDDYHWHIRLIPRFYLESAYTWSTGIFTNPIYPETAARYLRESLT